MAGNIISQSGQTVRKRTVPSNVLGPKVVGLAFPRKLNDTKFSGYGDIIINLPHIKLNVGDLNSIKDVNANYEADYDNTVTNKPSGVKAFKMNVCNVGNGYLIQKLFDRGSGRDYTRMFDGNTWGNWWYAYGTNAPQSIPSTIENANKLATPRKISLSGVTTGSAIFDGSRDIVISTTGVSYLGSGNGTMSIKDNHIEFSGSNITSDIWFGSNSTPTAYHFGSSNSAFIHAGAYYIGDTNIIDKFADIKHNHDTVYSKLGHKHVISDIDLQGLSLTAPKFTIKSDDIIIGTYDGKNEATFNVSPAAIGAAPEEHGLHVTFENNILPHVAEDNGRFGTSTKVARADHVHPVQTFVEIADRATKLRVNDMSASAMEQPTSITPLLRVSSINPTTYGLDDTSTIGAHIYIQPKDTAVDGRAYALGLFTNKNNVPIMKIRTNTAGSATWSGDWQTIYTTGNKPTPHEIGAIAAAGKSIAVDDSKIPK